jgi:hypothetical protein
VAARLPGYRTEWLERAPVFEYWAHAAAYLPWRDFRYTLARKRRIRERGHDWFQVDEELASQVLERIRAEGPLMARDFEAPKRTAGWWDWKPAKRALEYLFMAGDLMVTRRGFQKVFDLTERVLPPETDLRVPTPVEQAQWYVERALDAWGLVARDEIGYQRREHTDEIDAALADGEEAGALVRVAVEGIDKTPYWTRTADLSGLDALPRTKRELRILSPFDPFVIHRRRINRLFGFDFAIECYLPPAKRSFGYFALPLLEGDAFVGLLDAKVDRAAGTLLVQNLRYDGPTQRRAGFDAVLAKALREFAEFNSATWPGGGGPSD